MRELKLSTGSFDRENTFLVDVGLRYHGEVLPVKASLYCGKETADDGIYWALQHAAVIAASYSTDEIAEKERLAASEPLVNDEVVLINGEEYTAKVVGNYSDCMVFEKVEK